MTQKTNKEYMEEMLNTPRPFTLEKPKPYKALAGDDGKSKVLLIDGDIIAFRASAPCEGVYYTHPDIKEGPSTLQRVKYRKAITDMVKKIGGDISFIGKHKEVEPEAFAIYNVDRLMESLLKAYDTEDVYVRTFLTGKSNFRMALNPKYKSSRKSTPRPTHLNAAKQHLLNRYGAEIEEMYEADDLMGISAMEYKASGRPYVSCSIDKDLDTIPGEHYHFVNNKKYNVSKEEALRAFYMQCMTGDKTDDIPGIKGLGPKTAEKLLKGVNDPILMYQKGLTEWFKFLYPDITKDTKSGELLPTNELKIVVDTYRKSAELLWILRERGVMWSPPIDVLSPQVGVLKWDS